MEENNRGIMKIWKEETSNIKKYSPYHPSLQLKQMAALFTPGEFYYYIVNFHNLEMEYVHPGTKTLLGIPPDEFNLGKLVGKLPEEEIQNLEKKEALVADFFNHHISPEEIPLYKVMYFFKVRNKAGKLLNMLHQATTLTVSEEGKIEHVLGVQTDISHLTPVINSNVSLIHLKNGKSYYNLNPESGKFDPESASKLYESVSDHLTPKETEVLKLLSKGWDNESIAEKMDISYHTVRTHRKNMLRKTGCSNTSELVAKCLIEGVI